MQPVHVMKQRKSPKSTIVRQRARLISLLDGNAPVMHNLLVL